MSPIARKGSLYLQSGHRIHDGLLPSSACTELYPAPPGTRSATRSTTYASGSLIDPAVYAKLATNRDKKPVKVRVKAKAIPSTTGGQSAADASGSQSQRNRSKNAKPSATPGGTDSAAAAGGAATPAKKQKLDKSGLVNSMDGRVLAAFPVGRPFEPGSDMVQCKHCKKPVFRPAAPDHILDCLKKKQEKAQKKREAREAKEAALRKEANGGVSPDPRPFPKKSSTGGTGGPAELDSGGKKRGKKRKNAEEDGDGGPKRKRKRDQEKKGRTKGPVDVEKQCGVPMPNGQLCARSLTCKTHSMGLKRSVLGRSQKYDILLAQYQRKNHARQHRAAMEANAPVDDMEDPADIDSEEERDIVMNSINGYYKEDLFTGTRTMGTPLVTWDPAPLARRYNYIRLKGVLKSAIDSVHGSRLFTISAFGGGLFSGGGGGGQDEMGMDGEMEIDGEMESTSDGGE
jgi:SAGA-associated factor 73